MSVLERTIIDDDDDESPLCKNTAVPNIKSRLASFLD